MVSDREAGTEIPWPNADVPVELLDPAEMAEADRIAGAALTGAALMQRAGAAVAQAALRLLDERGDRHAVVLCGPGNNGGDGYVAARFLEDAGCRVIVAALGDPAKLHGDAAGAFGRWDGPTISLADAPIERADLVIDALFGAGLARDLDGAARTTVERINAWTRATRRPVLAVDVPSGVDGATGQIRGAAIRATDTITFFRLKPGHILMPARINCGAVELVDIGIERRVLDAINPQTYLNVPPLWRSAFPVPTLEGHKYGRGHALIVSGPIAQTGAARLCARGALRAGAGLVTVATPTEALSVHAAALTAIMTRVADTPGELSEVLADPRKNVVAMGPGLGVGESTRALVEAAMKPSASGAPRRHIVLDADALTSFAEEPRLLFDAIAKSGHAVVLTPHDGEFAKLFGTSLVISQSKPQRTREAARTSGAVVVLKGPDTVVAHPDGRAAIAASEAPWLATAGSGDVLGGIIAGLLAQAMPSFEAAAAGVWMHAEAARRYGPGLISEDIPELLPSVVSDILSNVKARGLTELR